MGRLRIGMTSAPMKLHVRCGLIARRKRGESVFSSSLLQAGVHVISKCNVKVGFGVSTPVIYGCGRGFRVMGLI